MIKNIRSLWLQLLPFILFSGYGTGHYIPTLINSILEKKPKTQKFEYIGFKNERISLMIWSKSTKMW